MRSTELQRGENHQGTASTATTQSYQMFGWSSWTLNEAPLIPLERVIVDLEKQIGDPGGSLDDLEIPLGEN